VRLNFLISKEIAYKLESKISGLAKKRKPKQLLEKFTVLQLVILFKNCASAPIRLLNRFENGRK
jgi:hypothetical protein